MLPAFGGRSSECLIDESTGELTVSYILGKLGCILQG